MHSSAGGGWIPLPDWSWFQSSPRKALPGSELRHAAMIAGLIRRQRASVEWLLLCVVTMPEFDAYLMVDWSASSRPVTGKDSVWYSLVVRTGDRLSLAAHENPPTRHRAMAEIRDILRGLARQE